MKEWIVLVRLNDASGTIVPVTVTAPDHYTADRLAESQTGGKSLGAAPKR
jgi:hypothetical protein